MEVNAKEVKKLRDTTGAGMMDAKKALQESKGDLEAAIKYLRKLFLLLLFIKNKSGIK